MIGERGPKFSSKPFNAFCLILGIANAASVLGPVIGYTLGGVVLTFYVDFDAVESSEWVPGTS